MTRTPRRLTAAIVGGALAGLLALPGIVAATTGEPIAETGGMTATLPLLGTTLSVDVTLDPTGNITTVALAPSTGFTQTKATDSVVKFSNDAGTTKVSVRAKGDRMSVSAKSTSLADFLGSGTWSADVFGTGSASTVDYTVGDDGNGNPTLTLGAINAAAGITATADAPKSGSDEDGADASVGVTFTLDGYVKHLRITISTDTRDGDAHLRITLSGKDRQKLTGSLADLAGERTWSAHLCDGTAVAVGFHVASDGTVVFDGSTGAPATDKTLGNGFRVRFDGTRVGVTAQLHPSGDGTDTLVVRGMSGRCGGRGTSGWGSHTGDHAGLRADKSGSQDRWSGGSGDGSSGGSHDGGGDGGDH